MDVVKSARAATRAVMRAVARDQTADREGRSALVLAPHPDDETLGCGATILRKVAAGAPVTIVVMTDGSASHRSAHVSPQELAALRRREMAEAAQRLGVAAEHLRWAGFADGRLADDEHAAAEYLSAVIRETGAEEVYATSAHESHPDHAALGRAARRAVGADGPELLEYPVWLWGSWPLQRGNRLGSSIDALGSVLARRVVKISAGDHLAGKLHALRAHESQLGRPPFVPPGEEWPVLPPPVLAAASDAVELFLPWVPRGDT